MVGNLIPNTFFITKGSGESDLEVHAGSYHMALYDAGISDFNIMVYSSVLPATARLVSIDEIDLPHLARSLRPSCRYHTDFKMSLCQPASSTPGCTMMRTSMRKWVA